MCWCRFLFAPRPLSPLLWKCGAIFWPSIFSYLSDSSFAFKSIWKHVDISIFLRLGPFSVPAPNMWSNILVFYNFMSVWSPFTNIETCWFRYLFAPRPHSPRPEICGAIFWPYIVSHLSDFLLPADKYWNTLMSVSFCAPAPSPRPEICVAICWPCIFHICLIPVASKKPLNHVDFGVCFASRPLSLPPRNVCSYMLTLRICFRYPPDSRCLQKILKHVDSDIFLRPGPFPPAAKM